MHCSVGYVHLIALPHAQLLVQIFSPLILQGPTAPFPLRIGETTTLSNIFKRISANEPSIEIPKRNNGIEDFLGFAKRTNKSESLVGTAQGESETGALLDIDKRAGEITYPFDISRSISVYEPSIDIPKRNKEAQEFL